MLCALGDSLRGDDPVTATRPNGPLHALQRMHGQQLQYSNVMPCARESAVPRFKMLPQLTEHRRQTPIVVNVRVIQIRRFPAEHGQIMQGIEHLFPLAVAPLVLGNGLAIAHHVKSVHVGFYRHRLEGMSTGNTVAILLPGHRLVLVDFADLAHGRLKRVLRQRQCASLVLAKTLADGFALAGDRSLPILLTASPQKEIQFGQIFDPRNGRRPLTF